MIGVDLGVVGVAVMGEMHVAEGFVLVQQDRAAYIADEMVEPEPPRILAGDVAVAGLVQGRLIGVENERVEDEPEPERDDRHRSQRGHQREGGNDAEREQHGGPRHHALIGLDQR